MVCASAAEFRRIAQGTALLLAVFSWAPLAAQTEYADLFKGDVDQSDSLEVRKPEQPDQFIMGDWSRVADRADYFRPGSGAVALSFYLDELDKASEARGHGYVHLSLVTLANFPGSETAFANRAEEIRQIFSANEIQALVLYDVAGKRSTVACALTQLSSTECTRLFTEAFALATGDRYAKFEAGLAKLHAAILNSSPSEAVLCSQSLLCQLTDWNSESWGETWLELILIFGGGLIAMAIGAYALIKFVLPGLYIAYAGLIIRGWFQFVTVTPVLALLSTVGFFWLFDELDISTLFVPAFAGALGVLVLLKLFLLYTSPGDRIRQQLDTSDLPRIFPE